MKEVSAANIGIETNELIIIKTNVPQDDSSINFKLNGSNQNTKCQDMKNGYDNVYIRFTDSKLKNKYLKLQFFNVPTIDGYYAFGGTAPGNTFEPSVVDTFTSLQFHLSTGEGHIGSNGAIYPTVFNLDFTYSNHNHNMFTINCITQTITNSSRITMNDLYDMYGDYFLNTCTCSGNGTSEDYNNLSTTWNIVKDSIFFSNSNKLPENFLSRFSTYTPISNTFFDQAIIRYDYILFYKGYGFDNFLSRSGTVASMNKINNTFIFNYKNKDNINLFIIIISSSICLLSITVLSVLVISKRRKET